MQRKRQIERLLGEAWANIAEAAGLLGQQKVDHKLDDITELLLAEARALTEEPTSSTELSSTN